MRQALLDQTPRTRGSTSFTANVTAPTGGLNTRDSLVDMPPDDAILLDNLYPRLGRINLRGGSVVYASGMAGTVKSFHNYNSVAGVSKLFAATDAGFYDITIGGPVGAIASSLTNGYCHSINMTNSVGTTFLWSCNGTNAPKAYNGLWSLPALTASGTGASLPNSAVLVYPILFKHRIMVIEKDSMNLWYLDIDAIQGPIYRIPLGNIFRSGGSLVSMTSWTLDSGEGSDDLLVIITSAGEVAVYQGIDPSSASSWSLVGVWQVGRPLGRRCFQRLSGDVLLLTENGVFPLSRILRAGKLNYASALSNKIQSEFTRQANRVGIATEGWGANIYPPFDAMVVNAPSKPGAPSRQFVMNTITGAWCTFSGWDAYCTGFFGNELFYGTTGGKVYRAWADLVGDDGSDIVATVYQAYNYFGSKTLLKEVTLFRPIIASDGAVQENWAISPDFVNVPLDAMLPRGSSGASGLWDVSDWDTTDWDTSLATVKLWRIATHQPGYALSLRLQWRTKASNLEWAGTDFILRQGGAM